MKRAASRVALALGIGLALAVPALAVPQDPQLERMSAQPAHALGVALGAALINVVYFPVRLAITAVSAELGGATAWLNGGDLRSAHAVWNVTEGQTYITPEILEGREPLRFGIPGGS